jgi:hypothetical protein
MNIPEARLATRSRRIDHLEPDPRKPHRHSHRQVTQLAHSTETYRLVVPTIPGATFGRSQQLFEGFVRDAGQSRTLADRACATEVTDAA